MPQTTTNELPMAPTTSSKFTTNVNGLFISSCSYLKVSKPKPLISSLRTDKRSSLLDAKRSANTSPESTRSMTKIMPGPQTTLRITLQIVRLKT